MTSNDELSKLCALAKAAGADLDVLLDADAWAKEGREIIQAVTVRSGVPGVGPGPMGAIQAAERLREAKSKGLFGPVIERAVISPMPRAMPAGMFDPMPIVSATFTDGRTRALFSYYPDELEFKQEEFVGMTMDEALDLKRSRDVQYIRDDPDRVRSMRWT